MKRYPCVYIVIANWNEQKLLQECLTSIKDFTDYPNFQIVVIDNGSTDGSAKMIRQKFSWVKLIENKVNMGFAKANNQGIKFAIREGADYIFLLSNDTRVIHRDWLTRVIEIAEANPNVGIVGCKLVYPDGMIQHAGGVINVRGIAFHLGIGKPDNGTYDEVKDVDYVTGAAFMIKRGLVQKIGLIDEGFFPALFEDTDYCVRAKMAGYRVVYNPKTTIIHYEGVTVKKRPMLKKNFIMHKNRIRFMLLNFPVKWLIKRVKYEFKTLISIVVEKKDKARKLSLLNVRLHNEWYPNLVAFIMGYLENFKNLNDILQKRKNRKCKIWY